MTLNVTISFIIFVHTHVHLQDGGLESSRKPLKWNADNPLNLDIPVKFISYISMGVVAVEICPALFLWIGI